MSCFWTNKINTVEECDAVQMGPGVVAFGFVVNNVLVDVNYLEGITLEEIRNLPQWHSTISYSERAEELIVVVSARDYDTSVQFGGVIEYVTPTSSNIIVPGFDRNVCAFIVQSQCYPCTFYLIDDSTETSRTDVSIYWDTGCG